MGVLIPRLHAVMRRGQQRYGTALQYGDIALDPNPAFATAFGSMVKSGLILMPRLIGMNLLSGSMTPMGGQPLWPQYAVTISPSTYFVGLSQAILYCGAGFKVVWFEAAALFVLATAFFIVALIRFRSTVVQAR